MKDYKSIEIKYSSSYVSPWEEKEYFPSDYVPWVKITFLSGDIIIRRCSETLEKRINQGYSLEDAIEEDKLIMTTLYGKDPAGI